MAVLRTKDPAEATRFCRSLVDRGFRRVDAAHSWQEPLRYRTFRIYRHRGWIRVAYQEAPSEGEPRKPIPVLQPPRTVKPGGACTATIGCTGTARYRGACNTCWHRYRYWNGYGDSRRAAARKAHAKAKAVRA